MDVFILLWKRRWHILFPTIISIAISIVISIYLQVWYKSSAILLPSSDDKFGLGGISSLVKDFVPIKGNKTTNTDRLLAILGSETILWGLITEFDLVSRYEIKEFPRFNTLKEIKSHTNFDALEDGTLIIEVWDTDSIIAKNMVLYLIEQLNKKQSDLAIQEAENNLRYLELRLEEMRREIFSVEDSLIKYQKKYGIIEVEAQAKAIISSFADLQSIITMLEVQKMISSQNTGEQSVQTVLLSKQIESYQKKMKELETGTSKSGTFNIMPPLKQLPDLGANYYRLYREVEIKNKTLLFIVPLIEQAKLESKKNIPSIIVLDPPQVPEKKDKPKRLFIVIATGFSVFTLLILFFIIWDSKEQERLDFRTRISSNT